MANGKIEIDHKHKINKKPNILYSGETYMTTSITAFRGQYAFLSNFYRSVFRDDVNTFTTVEQYFQYQKAKRFDDKVAMKKLLTCEDAKIAKRIGRQIQNFIPSKWFEECIPIMETGLNLKFKQNPVLLQKLLDTGNTELIEGNDWGDKFWGISHGEGKNNLGKLLMKIRDELQNK